MADILNMLIPLVSIGLTVMAGFFWFHMLKPFHPGLLAVGLVAGTLAFIPLLGPVASLWLLVVPPAVTFVTNFAVYKYCKSKSSPQ